MKLKLKNQAIKKTAARLIALNSAIELVRHGETNQFKIAEILKSANPDLNSDRAVLDHSLLRKKSAA
jgi:hypothetical protein